jgi:hypothetical protein
MLRTQAVGMKSCRPRSGLLTWHPSASTADSLLYYDVVIISIRKAQMIHFYINVFRIILFWINNYTLSYCIINLKV